MTSPSSSTHACPAPATFCRMNPSPPKMPAPSFCWNAMDSSTPSVPHRYPWWWIRYESPFTSTWWISPGTFVAKATVPGPPSALYSVMNRLPPANARFSPPTRPLDPAILVEVVSWMLSVSQDSSPDSAMTFSPASRLTSRTGSVVPLISWFTVPLPLSAGPPTLRPSGPVSHNGPSEPGAVQDERHRAVVHELDVHVLAERASRDPRSQRLQRLGEGLDPFARHLRRRRPDPRRPPAAAHVAVESELGHHEDLAPNVRQRAIHLPGLVFEHAQVEDLRGQLPHVGL